MSESLRSGSHERAESSPEVANSREAVLQEILTRELPSKELPDVLFSFSGGIVPRGDIVPASEDDAAKFKTMSYTDVGEHGLITGGKSRVIATAEIAQTFPEIQLVTTSRYYANWPTHAQVIERELVNKGIDQERIIKEEASFSTITQLVEMVKMAAKNDWHRVLAITNEYHLPRMQEMLNQLPTLFAHDSELLASLESLRERGVEMALISAEEVLGKLDPRWQKLIEAARETEPYKATVQAEQKGLRDLQEGRYVVSTTPKILPQSRKDNQ